MDPSLVHENMKRPANYTVIATPISKDVSEHSQFQVIDENLSLINSWKDREGKRNIAFFNAFDSK